MNYKIKNYFVFNIVFLFFFSNLLSLENQKLEFTNSINPNLNDCNLGYFYIDSNEQGSGGGHSGVLVYDFVFHYQRVLDEFFVLDKTDVSSFLFSYSRIQNRNLSLICIDNTFTSELKILSENLNLEFQRHSFYLEEVVYWRELKENLKNNQIYLPTLEYYTFQEDEFLEPLSKHLFFEELIQIYEGEIHIYLLEKIYKQYKKNLFINKDKFLEIQNFSLDDLTKDNFKKNLKILIEEWEKRNLELENSLREDKYIAILESQIYIETLKELYKNHRLYFPVLLVDKNKNLMKIQSKVLDFSLINQNNAILKSIQIQIINELNKLIHSVNSKEPFTNIQVTLQKISNLSNQLLLLLEKPHLSLQQQIYILHTPQVPKMITITNSILEKKQIEILINMIEKKENYYKNQIKEIFHYHLITENCVTKLFDFLSKNSNLIYLRELENSFTDTLKGKFIPWVSYFYFKNILIKYQISFKEYRFYSFRNELIEELRNQNLNSLKEITTISSEFYHYHPNDSFFIFFTENQIYLRPIFGMLNFIGSISYVWFDFIKQPYDFFIRKNEFFQSTKIELRGVFFSFTEIFFVSIRKGTFSPFGLPSKFQTLFFSLPKKRKKF